MSTITAPEEFKVARAMVRMDTNQRLASSPFSGSEQATDLLNDRWVMSLDLPVKTHAKAAQIESYINSMRGQVNVSPLYHFARPNPRGTARGSQSLGAIAAQGAASLVVTGISPATGTYLRGDMLGVGGLLVMCAADVAAVAGVATVTITNRIRTAQASGSVVTWDKPTALFRLLGHSGVQYVPGYAQETHFDYAEKI